MCALCLERQDQDDSDGEQNRKITHNRNLQMRMDRASNPRRPFFSDDHFRPVHLKSSQ
jgi:hypothetical protein